MAIGQMHWILSQIGFIFITYVVGKFTFVICKLLYELTSEKVKFPKDKWAVVTGAGAGIGRSFATELAKRGMNIVLISRFSKENERQEIEEIITKQCNRKVIFVKMDLSQFKQEEYDNLYNQLKNLDVAILVNNIGVSGHPSWFSSNDNDAIIRSNILPMVKMTEMLLPMIIEKNRKKGCIINISSAITKYSSSVFQIYRATKIFLSYFTKSLQYEYGNDVTIQLFETAMVYTRGAKDYGLKAPSYTAPTADLYVQHCLRALGKSGTTMGYWYHTLQNMLTVLVPDSVLRYILKKASEDLNNFNSV